MFDQLYASFEPIISCNMSGFLNGHSCATALIKLMDDWRSDLDKKETGVVAIDLSKAFEYICHSLLLAKVQAYGVQEQALQYLRSYLHKVPEIIAISCKKCNVTSFRRLINKINFAGCQCSN